VDMVKSELGNKDTTVYFAVFNKNIYNWFIRINLDAQKKFIMTRMSVDKASQCTADFEVEQTLKGYGEGRIYINSADDVPKLDKLINECFDDLSNQPT